MINEPYMSAVYDHWFFIIIDMNYKPSFLATQSWKTVNTYVMTHQNTWTSIHPHSGTGDLSQPVAPWTQELVPEIPCMNSISCSALCSTFSAAGMWHLTFQLLEDMLDNGLHSFSEPLGLAAAVFDRRSGNCASPLAVTSRNFRSNTLW